MTGLGVVSFLNARPLFDSLVTCPEVALRYAVPSALEALLVGGEVDAALLPVVDCRRHRGQFEFVSDAGIACDGETMTVRVFLRAAPQDVDVLYVDSDSHTSIVLAQVIWRKQFARAPTLRRAAEGPLPEDCRAVLLIGDKVVTRPPERFARQLDLGAAWKDLTGLPFVFAAWAAPSGADHTALGRLLESARDAGMREIPRLAREAGPRHGWPPALAEEYLGRRLRFVLGAEYWRGMELFLELAEREGLLEPASAEPASVHV